MTNSNKATVSKPMTKAQAAYAMGRLDDIWKQRLINVVAGVKKPDELLKLDYEEKYAIIASGKAKLKPISKYLHIELTSAYTYPQHEANLAKFKVQEDKYLAECTKLQKPVHAAYRVAMDTLMLGDASEALQVIERFAAGK